MTSFPSGQQWRIASGEYAATVVEVGGGLRSLTRGGADLVHGYAEGALADAARGHVLAPWPNRIAGGTYGVNGERYELAWTEPEHHNAAHGLVRWLPWQLVEHRADRLTTAVTLHPQPGWAWTLRLQVTYVLDGGGLTVMPCATNLSDTPCPFGFGMHPYLTAGEATLDDTTLTAPVRERLVVDDHRIPIGRASVEQPFGDGAALAGVGLDTCFTGLTADADGCWRVSLTAGDRTTTLWAEADAFAYVQMFTGDELPALADRRSGLAVEPMTCPANAFNSGEGLRWVEPGGIWSARFGITGS